MHRPRSISAIQTAAVLASTAIGVGVLPLPLFAVRTANSGAPLITVLGILVGLAGLTIAAILAMRHSDQSLVEYSESLLGKPLAWFGNTLVIVFFAVLTSLAAREFGSVVVTTTLHQTPIEVTVFIMLLLAAVSARYDVRTFAYIHQFYLPIILAPALFIVIISFTNYEMTNVMPLLGNETSGVVRGILTIAALLQGSFVITLVVPYMRQPRKAWKAGICGLTIAGTLYLIIVIAAVSVFGAEEVKLMLWPTLELAKATSLPANILERQDAWFMSIWVTAVFTTLLSSYYVTVHTLGTLIRLHDHKMLPLFLLPFIFAASMLPDNVLQLYTIIEIIGLHGLWITIGFPLLLLAVSFIRRSKEGVQ